MQRTGSDQPGNCVLGAVCSGVPCGEDGPPALFVMGILGVTGVHFDVSGAALLRGGD